MSMFADGEKVKTKGRGESVVFEEQEEGQDGVPILKAPPVQNRAIPNMDRLRAMQCKTQRHCEYDQNHSLIRLSQKVHHKRTSITPGSSTISANLCTISRTRGALIKTSTDCNMILYSQNTRTLPSHDTNTSTKRPACALRERPSCPPSSIHPPRV